MLATRAPGGFLRSRIASIFDSPGATMNVSLNRIGSNAMSDTADRLVSRLALTAGYTAEEIRAGLEFSARKARRIDPPGSFDKAGRFDAAERTSSVRCARMPSRAFPYSEMHAARTAAHCAEVFGAQELLAVKRVAKLRDEVDGSTASLDTAHAEISAVRAASDVAKRILKPVNRQAVDPAA
jgi:hypothetical protein